MAVADELVARLKGVPGVAAVFDAFPVGYSVGASPVLSVHHISSVPIDPPIDGELCGFDERWQVSVRGSNLARVRAAARDVRDILQGFTSDSIHWCAYESSPGTMQESDSPLVYHAPVDFMIFTT